MDQTLGQLQLQVMEVVWRLERATVGQVHAELARQRKIAYTTVLTTLRALERRGMVRHGQEGKAYLYEPTVSREDYTAGRVGTLVRELFQGSREKLLCHLLGTSEVSPAELTRVRKMLRKQGGQGAMP